jgi:hypothetical protein
MESDFVVIGEREVWGYPLLCGLARQDRRQHLYIIGQTGTGKSTLLSDLIAQDIANGDGCAFIDPHGDTARQILSRIPAHRTDHVVLIEPADLANPVALNPFFRVPKDDRPLVASNLVATFRHLWRDSWGPRLEYLLYNTIAAVLDAPDHLRPTLLSIPRMYVDPVYRRAIVTNIQDPQVRQFWVGEFESWSERFLAEVISPVQNKVGALVASPALRNILGQWRPTMDLAQIMNEQGILIANLSKGQIGEDKANMLGAFIVSGFEAAAMRRARLPEADRRDFYLHIDEFHNFGTDAFASILSESRKMRLSLTIAHQYIAQVPELIQDAIFGNVGSIVAFRVGAEDAERLARELTEYSPATLRSLPRGMVCARLLQSGEIGQPFLGQISAPVPHGRGRDTNIRLQSRQRYARDRAIVEANISAWFSRSQPDS